MLAARREKIKEAMEATNEVKLITKRQKVEQEMEETDASDESFDVVAAKYLKKSEANAKMAKPILKAPLAKAVDGAPKKEDLQEHAPVKKTRLPLVKRVIKPKNLKDHKSIIVSSQLHLDETLRLNANRLYQIPLIPLNLNFNRMKELTEKTKALRPTIKKERLRTRQKHDVTLLFAIRRPGCGACREHGMQLAQLHKEEDFNLIGAVKETNVDNDALLEFYHEYFHFPIYKDEGWEIFKAMGGRKIPFWQLIKRGVAIQKRYREKNIKNVPFGGDIWTQGGLLLFDKRGKLRYAYYENYGDEMDMEEIRRAIAAVKEQSRQDETGSSFGSSLDSSFGDESDAEDLDESVREGAILENLEDVEDDMLFFQ